MLNNNDYFSRILSSTLTVQRKQVVEYFGPEDYWCICLARSEKSNEWEKTKKSYIREACKFTFTVRYRDIMYHKEILLVRFYNFFFRFGTKISKTTSTIWWGKIWREVCTRLSPSTRRAQTSW